MNVVLLALSLALLFIPVQWLLAIIGKARLNSWTVLAMSVIVFLGSWLFMVATGQAVE